MSGARIRFETVHEETLSDALRAALGDLLADAYDPDDPEQAVYLRRNAHWSVPPLTRIIARDGARVVGQVSVHRMGPGVMGLGGGAVAASHRRRGIMTSLIERGLELCGDDVVLTRTVFMRSLYVDELGFQPVQLPQLAPYPDWLGRGDMSLVGELEIDDV